jgi:hypothetical protein
MQSGWYPVGGGTERYYDADSRQWTNASRQASTPTQAPTYRSPSPPSEPPSSPFTPAREARYPLSRPDGSPGSVRSIQSGGLYGSIHSDPDSPDRTGQLGPGNLAYDPNDPQYDQTHGQEGWHTDAYRHHSPTLPQRQVVPHPARDTRPPSHYRRGPPGPPPSRPAQPPAQTRDGTGSVVSIADSDAYAQALSDQYSRTSTSDQRHNWVQQFRRTGVRPVQVRRS